MSKQREAAEALAAEIRENASADIHGDVSWAGDLADMLEGALRTAAAGGAPDIWVCVMEGTADADEVPDFTTRKRQVALDHAARHNARAGVVALHGPMTARPARYVREGAPAFVAWTRDSPGGGCPEEVMVREQSTGYYGDAECTLECEGITGHAGPHFTREVDGHVITFAKGSPDA